MTRNISPEALEAIDARFCSGNSVPVDRAIVPRQEWEALKAALPELQAAQPQAKELTDERGRPMTYWGGKATVQQPQAEQKGAGDALREAAQFAADVLSELYAKYSTKIGPFSTQAQLANVRLGTALRALAARQPVGQEPVLRIYAQGGMRTVTEWLDGARDLQDGDHALYTAPPAQMDLGPMTQLIADAAAALDCKGDKKMAARLMDAHDELLAAIDSQERAHG